MTKEMKEMRKKLIREVLVNWKHKKRMKGLKKNPKNPDIGSYYFSLNHSSTGEVEKSKNLKGDSYINSVLGDMSHEDIYSPYDPDRITVTSNHWD